MPFLTFYPAVTLAIFFAGAGPGFFAIALSAVMATYLWTPPYGEFIWSFDSFTVWSNLSFCATEITVIFISEAFHKHRKNYFQISNRLKRDREWLKLLANHTEGVASFKLDKNGRVSSWNKGAENLLGFTDKEILGQSHASFYMPEDIKSGLPANTLKLARQEGVYENPGWRIKKDGSKVFMDVIVSPVHDQHGEVQGYIKIHREIFDQIRNEYYLQTIMHSAPIPLLILNAQNEIVMLNRQTEKLFGYPSYELLGKELGVFIPELFRENRKKYLAEALLSAKAETPSATLKLSAIHKNGREITLEAALSPIDFSGAHLILVTLYDLTQRIQSQRLQVEKLLPEIGVPSQVQTFTDREPLTPVNTISVKGEHAENNVKTEYETVVLPVQTDEKPLNAATDNDGGSEISPALTALAPLFNVPETLTRLRGDERLLNKLLLSFADNYAAAAEEVGTFLANDQPDKAASLLHRLTGAAAHLGAADLAAAAQKLKDEIRTMNAPESNARFAQHLKEAVTAIRRYVLATEPLVVTMAAEPSQITEAIINLSQALNKHEVPSDAQLQALYAMLANRIPRSLLDTLDKHLQEFDFLAASQTLRKINDEYQYNA
jgi:PAS domain S-box-containing protein